MKDEFEFGELVEVRENDQGAWLKRYYVGTLHQPPPHAPLHFVMFVDKTPKTYDGIPGYPCKQIRKIQPKTLEERIQKLEDEINQLKNSLK